MQTRKRKPRRSYNSESDESNSSSDEDDQRSYSIPGSLSDEGSTMAECPMQDLDATEVTFTGKPIPEYQEIEGDLFSSRIQKKKGHTYALAHCISSDATMGAGIAVDFCKHFVDLRRRVESEVSVKPALISIFYEEERCWVYNLGTKRFHFNRPNRDDFRECLVLMREHALLIKLEEIHMPCIGAGLDALEWSQSRSTILEIFRDQKIRITVYVPSSSGIKKRETTKPLRKDSASSDTDQTLPYDSIPERTREPVDCVVAVPSQEQVHARPEVVPTQCPTNAVAPIMAETPVPTQCPTNAVYSARSISSSRVAHPASSRSVQTRTENSSGEDSRSKKELDPTTDNCSGEDSRSRKRDDPATQNSSGEKPDESPGQQRYRLRPHKGNKYSRRFLRKLMSDAPYTVSTIQKNSSDLFQKSVSDYNKPSRKSVPEPTSNQKNMNVGKNGVEPITLKVYEWFDNPTVSRGENLSARQVGELIAAGKVTGDTSRPRYLGGRATKRALLR